MRKIAVVTGTRADFGYLQPLMKKINEEEGLDLLPIITGMHLLESYGNSYKIVESQFENSIKVPMTFSGTSHKDMASYVSSGIKNFSDMFSEFNPDIVIALGDRSEAFAAAIASVYLNIPFAHINGGDVSGTTLDESIRHSITKLAHIHFVHTQGNALRVERMGEEKQRIFVTGALALDTILNTNLINKEDIFNKYSLDPKKPTFLVIHHPVTTLKDNGFSQLEQLFLVLNTLEEQTVFIYPNCDAGSKNFIDLINRHQEKSYLHVFKNLPYLDYLSLLRSCNVMIGNSSSGIIEAPSFQIPVINIGNRQQGRERSANIIDVNPSEGEIKKAIEFSLNDIRFKQKIALCKNKFGDGETSKRIVKILKEIDLSEKIIQKQITY